MSREPDDFDLFACPLPQITPPHPPMDPIVIRCYDCCAPTKNLQAYCPECKEFRR